MLATRQAHHPLSAVCMVYGLLPAHLLFIQDSAPQQAESPPVCDRHSLCSLLAALLEATTHCRRFELVPSPMPSIHSRPPWRYPAPPEHGQRAPSSGSTSSCVLCSSPGKKMHVVNCSDTNVPGAVKVSVQSLGPCSLSRDGAWT